MTIMTMNCIHGHYAGPCKSFICECRCHAPRIGTTGRPDREWEVWDRGARYGEASRWCIWHPILSKHEIKPMDDALDTLADALDEVAIIELLFADRFEQWRENH